MPYGCNPNPTRQRTADPPRSNGAPLGGRLMQQALDQVPCLRRHLVLLSHIIREAEDLVGVATVWRWFHGSSKLTDGSRRVPKRFRHGESHIINLNVYSHYL